MTLYTHLLYRLNGMRNERQTVRRLRKATLTSFQKSYDAALPDLEWAALENERTTLEAIQSWSQKRSTEKSAVLVPKIMRTHQTPTSIGMETALFTGNRIETATPQEQRAALIRLLDFIDTVSNKPHPQLHTLHRTYPIQIICKAPILLVLAVLRKPSRATQFLRAYLGFVHLYFPRLNSSLSLSLAHGDLDPHNLMTNGTDLLIADWENAQYTDPLVDLASVVRLWYPLLPLTDLLTIAFGRVSSAREEKSLLGLILYGCLSTLAHAHNKEHNYAEALQILDQLDSQAKTPYEYVSGILFSALARLSTWHRALRKPAAGGAILCYHNLGSDPWRFSTPVWEFEAHIQYLQKHTTIKTLSEVIRTGEGVAITFDDGYASIATQALPVCEKYGIKATVFVLGDPEHADRKALDNHLPFLTDAHIQLLLDHGWEIGYHTSTHLDLEYASPAQLEDEIVAGKYRSEKQRGLVYRYFAYPKGVANQHIVNLVKQAGFIGACTVDGHSTHYYQDTYRIDRISIERGFDANRVAIVLTPVGMQLTSLFTKLLQWKERMTHTL